MSMTLFVTNNASPRVRGFLASVALELTPGVYCAGRISPSVRERIWAVLADWFSAEDEASILMVWPQREMPGGQAFRTLGSTRTELVDVDGILLSRRLFATPQSRFDL